MKIDSIKRSLTYFSVAERIIWLISVSILVICYFFFEGGDLLAFIASITGVTFILLNAKGNPLGQFLGVIFSLIYGYISYSCAYYGEMITYLGMTAPMAIAALISWLRHPYKGNKSQVEVNTINKKEYPLIVVLTIIVTVAFYFILKYLGTANLIPSTLSITTSFVAVYLTFRRSPYFAIAYTTNDIVLIVLWTLPTISNPKYLSVLICFYVFLINDIYCFISWRKMKQKQALNQ